jgi:hypothetical protein
VSDYKKKIFVMQVQENHTIPTMLSSFTLWAKVKALADEKLQAGPYFLIT